MELQPTRSDNKGSQGRPRVKYGSQPPKCFASDAELSQWLLEAEKEDERLAEIELAEKRRIAAEKFGSRPSTKKQPAPAVQPRFHRGCKYRLPSTDPIAIPTFPYEPFCGRWYHQNLRRTQVLKAMKAPKKYTKFIYDLVEIGFAFGCQNDLEYNKVDSYDFGEKDDKQCPICSCPPEAVNQEIKIAVDQVIEVAADQEIEIGVDAAAIITSTNPATQDTQASATTTVIGQTRPTGRTE